MIIIVIFVVALVLAFCCYGDVFVQVAVYDSTQGF